MNSVFSDDFCAIGIDLVAEIPPKECTERVVYCDGGDPHLGHPKVYINLVSSFRPIKSDVSFNWNFGKKTNECFVSFQDKPGAHACGYCGLRYVLKEGHHH